MAYGWDCRRDNSASAWLRQLQSVFSPETMNMKDPTRVLKPKTRRIPETMVCRILDACVYVVFRGLCSSISNWAL